MAEAFGPTGGGEDYIPAGLVPSRPSDLSRLGTYFSGLTSIPSADVLASTLRAAPAELEADSLYSVLYELQDLLEVLQNVMIPDQPCSPESGSIPSGSIPSTP